MSGLFDDDNSEPTQRVPPPGPQPRSRALIGTIVVLVIAFFLVSVFTGVWTDRLWFKSVGFSEVFSKMLGTKVLLFIVFGLLMAVAVGANVVLAYRFRPLFRPSSAEQVNLDRYREVVDPLRRWLVVGLAIVLGLFAGGSGSGQWRQYLLWRHGGSFGKKDATFHKDVGFYVFDLPWLHYLVDFAMAAAVLSLLAAAVVHYLFGGIRLQAKQDRLSGAAQVQISVLAGMFVLFKGADFWLDRYNLTSNSGGLFTGVTFTDQQAVLPAKTILTFIAIICAVLFFANVLRRTWLLPSVGLALLVLSSILLGAIWPGIVQQFQVKPSEPAKEATYLANNIKATREAYGIADTKVTQYDAKLTLSQARLQSDASSIPGVRLLDPALVSDAFEQLQQVRGFYSVPRVLDVDRYPVNGKVRDMVLAVRELDQTGLPDSQRNWANEHTVYTHGYGVIAAYGNQSDKNDRPVTNSDGKPVWAERDLPPVGVLSDMFPDGYQPRIYFGEKSPNYSIVGKAPNGKNIEFDLPESSGLAAKMDTYSGAAGVPIGNLFNQLLYAVKFSEPNIVLSSLVNQNSKILYDRSPRNRVQKVAPWLTVDGDAYPAVVDGKVKWILDGYTTTDMYPNSEKDSLRSMTSDALSPNTTYATLPTDQINYMRNSVKAVVDAYDGTVDLYEWNAPNQKKDPILAAWEGAFPGSVKPKSPDPARAAPAHALPRGPVQGAAQHAGRLPRHRRQDVLRRRRPVEGAGGPREQGEQAAAVPTVGADPLGRPGPGLLADQRVRAAEAAEPRVVHLGGLRRSTERLRHHPDPAAAEQHPGAGALADRELLRQRPADPAAGAAVHPVQRQGDLRQPADAAGRGRPALRAAALHPAQHRAGHLSAAAVRARVVR